MSDTIMDNHGTEYVPWQDGEMVGFKVIKMNGEVSYIYLNPSGEDSEGVSNVFLYMGNTGDPSYDKSIIYVVP